MLRERAVLKRKIETELLRWKNELAPRYALFLTGAPMAGKTALAQQLAKTYRSSILIRLDEASEELKSLFTEGLADLETFFALLQLLYRTKLYRGKSLIILDAVEAFPPARQALKRLLEDGRYHYLETGTKAAVVKAGSAFLVPSEEYAIDVFPMDFEEFLWAQGDDRTMPVLRACFEKRQPLGAELPSVQRALRDYLLTGGMPAVVKAFAVARDLGKADTVKQRLLTEVMARLQTQKVVNPDRVMSFFKQVPAELSRRSKPYVIAHAAPGARLREYQGTIHWLEAVGLVQLVNRASAFDLTDGALARPAFSGDFRCFLADTGLLATLAGNGQPMGENPLCREVLTGRLQAGEGMLLLNFVVQCLLSSSHPPFFYSERDPQTRKAVAEVDFLFRRGSKTAVLQVKTGPQDRLKSLRRLDELLGGNVGDRWVLHAGDVEQRNGVWHLPWAMACVL